MKQENINVGNKVLREKMNKNLTVYGNVLIFNATMKRVDGEVTNID